MYWLEKFGVWCTNQCIDYPTDGRVFYLRLELVDKMLDMLEEYLELNTPVTATIILSNLRSRVEEGWFYNCPDESMVANDKKPAYLIDKILTNQQVKTFFKGARDPHKVAKRISRLLRAADKHTSWQESWGKSYFSENSPYTYVIREWREHMDDDAHWEEKQAEAKSA